MKNRTINTILLLMGVVLFSGCSGKHVKPPSDYYSLSSGENIVRVAFDQNGHIYPLDTKEWNWNDSEYELNWFCKLFGCGYQLKKLHDGEGKSVYNQVQHRDSYITEVTKKLNKITEESDRLAIFIHGFNNDFTEAQEIYDAFKEKIDADIPVLMVYWDGVDNDIPLKIWFPSLTYSNLAGQIGLRPILNGLNKPVDLTVVTHSRGAAVAVSAFSDPIYDDNICAPQEDKPICSKTECDCLGGDQLNTDEPTYHGYHEPDFSNIKSLNFVFFAPAIGNGHFWHDMDRFLPKNKVTNFYLGTNPEDFATSKSIVPSDAFGDTSLGGNQDSIDEVVREFSDKKAHINIEQIRFTHGSDHGITNGYFSKINGDKPECMLWASGLRSAQPDGCVFSKKLVYAK